MVAHVKAQREENVIPNEHLHFGLFARVYGHHVAIDNGHGTTGSRSNKVAVDLTINNLLYTYIHGLLARLEYLLFSTKNLLS